METIKKTYIIALITSLLVLGLVAAGSWHYGFEQLMNSGSVNQETTNLCYKDANGPNNVPGDADDWTCERKNGLAYPNAIITGTTRYALISYNKFTGSATLYGLKANTQYQIKLNSYGSGFVADALANACPAPNTGPLWECGYWGDEGFLVLATVTTNSMGTAITNFESYWLPEGVYRTKFLVTENADPWDTPLMEEKQVEFVIVNQGGGSSEEAYLR